jgi:hypothetical protein
MAAAGVESLGALQGVGADAYTRIGGGMVGHMCACACSRISQFLEEAVFGGQKAALSPGFPMLGACAP